MLATGKYFYENIFLNKIILHFQVWKLSFIKTFCTYYIFIIIKFIKEISKIFIITKQTHFNSLLSIVINISY